MIGDKPVPDGIVANVIGFITLYVLLFGFGVLVMAWAGLDMISAIGSVATTLGNVGPGLGSVGPVENYFHIPVIGKWFLSFMMLIGRLEIYTVLVIFTPSFRK